MFFPKRSTFSLHLFTLWERATIFGIWLCFLPLVPHCQCFFFLSIPRGTFPNSPPKSWGSLHLVPPTCLPEPGHLYPTLDTYFFAQSAASRALPWLDLLPWNLPLKRAPGQQHRVVLKAATVYFIQPSIRRRQPLRKTQKCSECKSSVYCGCLIHFSHTVAQLMLMANLQLSLYQLN
jgi:hypothetical protein